MPKKYPDSHIDLARARGDQDMSPSARTQMRQDLKQLGFAHASENLQPQKNGFAMHVSQGSFQSHLEQMFWVRRSANNVAKMVGREPDPAVETLTQATVRSKPANSAWKKDHRQSGRLKAGEENFARILTELMTKLQTSFDSLVYTKDFDMVTLKTMDRQTLAMYMAKAETDIQEVTTIYSQLVGLLPYLEGASGAVQRLGEITARIAVMRGELVGCHRVFRQESMVIRGKSLAGGVAES